MNDEPSKPRDSLEYEPETDTYRVTYTNVSNPASMALVDAVATITDRDVDELTPLYRVLDPTALDTAFRSTADGRYRSDGEISFTYEGFDVTVKSYGVITIEPADGGEDEDDPTG